MDINHRFEWLWAYIENIIETNELIIATSNKDTRQLFFINEIYLCIYEIVFCGGMIEDRGSKIVLCGREGEPKKHLNKQYYEFVKKYLQFFGDFYEDNGYIKLTVDPKKIDKVYKEFKRNQKPSKKIQRII